MAYGAKNQRRLVGQERRGRLRVVPSLYIILRLLVVFIALGLHPASATSLSGADAGETPGSEKSARDLAEKLQESKKGLVEAEAQKRKILGSLYVVNQRMKKISLDKSKLTNDLFQVQDNVKSLAKIIANLEIQIDKQRDQLKRRLRALYKLSGQSYLGIVFSRATSSDFDETLRFLKIVTENDYLLIRGYQQNLASYKAQKNKLRVQVEKLVGIEKNIKKQETLLAGEHQAKSKIVLELEREKVASLNRIKSLRTKTKELGADQQISELLKPSIYEQKGQLRSPVQGSVVQEFGLITDERYKIRLSHKGWRYETGRGAGVAAIYDGTVVHAEYVNGYGQTVIIDHSDHYYSLYAHVSRLKVSAGDSVKKGQLIAETGPPAGSFNEGIYFEIRHFSEPENPANWISTAHTSKNTQSIVSQQASIARAAD